MERMIQLVEDWQMIHIFDKSISINYARKSMTRKEIQIFVNRTIIKDLCNATASQNQLISQDS